MCLAWSSYGMDDLLENFPKSMWVRTKHAKNSCVGLWGQSLILKVVEVDCRGLEKGYLQKVMTGGWFWPTKNWVKCHSVRDVEKSTIKDITLPTSHALPFSASFARVVDNNTITSSSSSLKGTKVFPLSMEREGQEKFLGDHKRQSLGGESLLSLLGKPSREERGESY